MNVTTTEDGRARGLAGSSPKPPDQSGAWGLRLIGAVSHPVRAEIVLVLRDGPVNVAPLAGLINRSVDCVGYHLSLLRLAGLIEDLRDGQRIYYRLTQRGVQAAQAIESLLG